MPLRIEDYALIGDCQTAALVGKDGSIDWLCLPYFDSEACFAALLGAPKNGRWLLAPAESEFAVRRRYQDDSLILETEFEIASGAVTIVDFMPPRSEQPELVRLVRGTRGAVRMKMELVIRFDYGSIVPWVTAVQGGIHAIAGPDALVLETPVELRGENFTTIAEFTVSAGEQIPFVLSWYPSHEPAPARTDPAEAFQQTA